MTEQHVPIEDLAAYAAGDLDATAAVAVEAHVLLCADCRSDVDAVNAAAAALAGVSSPAMPADVAARLDAALAAEDDDAHPTVVPMARRRRPSFAGIAAVAAGVALVGAITVPLLSSGGPPRSTSTAALDGADREAAPAESRRLSSNLDYTHATLATTLASALKGATTQAVTDSGTESTAGGTGATPRATVSAPPAEPAAGEAPVPMSGERLTTFSLESIQTDPARLAACLSTLTADFPAQGRTPVVIDFARFAGRPAIVMAFPTVTQGRVRNDRFDVYVVGPECGTGTDAPVLDFQRIPRPQ